MRAKEQEKGRQSDDWFQEKPANWPLLQSCLGQGKQEESTNDVDYDDIVDDCDYDKDT